MEAKRRGRTQRIDLRLNLSPVNSSSEIVMTSSSSEVTVEGSSSCVSWEAEEEERVETKAMMLVGCRQCLMYVLLSEIDPKCPKCKSTVLLDFLNNDDTSSTTNTKPDI